MAAATADTLIPCSCFLRCGKDRKKHRLARRRTCEKCACDAKSNWPYHDSIRFKPQDEALVSLRVAVANAPAPTRVTSRSETVHECHWSLGNHAVHCPAKRPDKAALGLQVRVPCLASTPHTAGHHSQANALSVRTSYDGICIPTVYRAGIRAKSEQRNVYDKTLCRRSPV